MVAPVLAPPEERAPEDNPYRPWQVYFGFLWQVIKTLFFLAISVLAMIGLWEGFLKLFHLNPYFAKGPGDVWRYVTSDKAAGANRQELWQHLGQTVRDAALGYVAGTVAAVVTAVLFVLSRAVEQTFMPIAVVLRSVPLVAMTPLLALVFGRSLLGVTVIAGIVTYFPSLVNLVQGLRSAPSDAFALMAAYDASPWTVMRKIRLPCAMPSLFASARIAAPGALLGAVLAEWLATGKGLGYLMLQSVSSSRFATLWTSVVIITVLSFTVYAIVGLIETPVLKRFAPAQDR
jgi:ABC-type nitrate/sulfonate/bicarbonate transport system permease component